MRVGLQTRFRVWGSEMWLSTGLQKILDIFDWCSELRNPFPGFLASPFLLFHLKFHTGAPLFSEGPTWMRYLSYQTPERSLFSTKRRVTATFSVPGKPPSALMHTMRVAWKRGSLSGNFIFACRQNPRDLAVIFQGRGDRENSYRRRR